MVTYTGGPETGGTTFAQRAAQAMTFPSGGTFTRVRTASDNPGLLRVGFCLELPADYWTLSIEPVTWLCYVEVTNTGDIADGYSIEAELNTPLIVEPGDTVWAVFAGDNGGVRSLATADEYSPVGDVVLDPSGTYYYNQSGSRSPQGPLDWGLWIQAVSEESVEPVSATFAGDLPALAASLTGTASVSGTLNGTLPPMTASLDGTVAPAGALEGELPALQGSFLGSVLLTSVFGNLVGVLPMPTASMVGTVAEVEIPPVPGQLSVALPNDTVSETPTGLILTIGNGQPGETVTFSVVDEASDFQSIDLDDFGIAQEATVILPPLAAGTYLLRTVGTLSGSTDVTFIVQNSPLAQAPIIVNVPVRPVTAPVQHWRFYDLRDPDLTWTFTHNPKTWNNLFPPNDFTHGKTTAPDGEPLTWQAAARPWRMECTGYLTTEEEYDQLVFWSELRRRFWLIDHRNRAWLLTIEQFDAQAKLTPHKPWAHDYTLKTMIFMQG